MEGSNLDEYIEKPKKMKKEEIIKIIDEEIKSHKEHYPKLSAYARGKHKHTIIILKKIKQKIKD